MACVCVVHTGKQSVGLLLPELALHLEVALPEGQECVDGRHERVLLQIAPRELIQRCLRHLPALIADSLVVVPLA
eukprot:SAG25_NODE_8374_length_425_cov_0.843558_1_plen_74_part_10